MKKRILSSLICIIMLISSVSGIALADNQNKIISWAEIYGLESPYAGEYPDYNVYYRSNFSDNGGGVVASDINLSSYWKNGILWEDTTAEKYLTPGVDKFIEGHVYEVTFQFKAEDGYEFYVAGDRNGNNINVYFNFKKISNASTNQFDRTKYTVSSYTYSACKKRVAGVELCGNDPVYNGTISNANPVASEGIAIKEIQWYEDLTKISDTQKFKSGKEYFAIVHLKAKDGYAIPHNSYNLNAVKENFTVTANGEELYWEKVSEDGKEFEIATLYYLGYVNNYTITHVTLRTISAPVAGRTPDYTASVNRGIYISDIRWYTPGGTKMSSTDKFESGKKYTVEVDVNPGTNYTLSVTHATINGKVATRSGSSPLTVKYTFDACPGVVSDINLSISAPTIGAKPSYDPSENDNGYSIDTNSYNPNYEKNGAWWYDVTNNKNMLIGGAGVVFKENDVYRVRITIEPDDGFTFASGLNAKVNGKNAFIEFLDSGLVNVYYYFNPLVPDAPCKNGHSFTNYVYNNDATTQKDGTKTAKCDNCAVTDTVTATGTKWTNPFTDVKAGKFYYDSVLWAVNNSITSGITPTTFEPNSTCTRAQVVAFLWRAAGSPEPKSTNNPFTDVKAKSYYYKAVLWAVENGITSGVSATSFAPNDNCTRGQIVAFLWRSQGSPKVKASNPFTDVKSSAYYYDAVLWAVQSGVTSGVSATSFAPKDNCTRGQIVSFLYRCLK